MDRGSPSMTSHLDLKAAFENVFFIFTRELYLFSEFVSELSVLRGRFVLIRRHTSVNVNVSYRKTSSSRCLGRRG